MRESEAFEDARRSLGAQLAARRRAAGYSQVELAAVVGYSRSTVANVEVGRQHVPRGFWQSADAAVHAEGALTQVSDEIEAAVRREREEAARRLRSLPAASAHDSDAVAALQLAHFPAGAAGPPSDDVGWLDMIALAASQAREHAEKMAITDIGPGTVEQLRADVVRLGRAYVSAPPLPLFAGMHHAFSRVQAALQQRAYPDQARDLNFLAGALCGLMAGFVNLSWLHCSLLIWPRLGLSGAGVLL